MLTVYGIKNCDTVKKALRFLEAHAIPFTFHDFKTSPVSTETVRSWADRGGIDKLLNTKGTTYRTLGIKALDLDDDAKVQWMSEHNLLIKRPVIEYNGGITIGFDQSQYEGTFLS
jgi:Spx/MgsR family transcriptional regulator